MQQLAEQLDDGHVVQEVGTLEGGGEPGVLFVRTSGGRYRARPAVSCLVEPVPDDRVLVATTARGDAFVLAVLERPTDAPPRLRVEGDLDVSAGGRLRFVAKDGVDIATEQDINLVSQQLDVRSKRTRLVLDAVDFVGKVARVDAQQVKSFVGLLDQVVDRFHQKAKRSYRFIEEVDVTRADQIDMRAEENINLRGRNAVVNAEQLVKMDARQIHLG